MDADDSEEAGSRKIEELFKEYQILYAKSYPSSPIDFNKLNLTPRVRQSKNAIGKGHHSNVFKGTLDSHTIVGIKILRLPVYDPQQERLYESVVLRFFRELYHWHELDHINIVRLLGFTFSRGDLGFVSLWYPRGNLVQHVQRCPDASYPDLMLDVAEGVHYLHTLDESIIHGDLKGVNILVTERGIACIADFGISKQISDLNRHTGFSTTKGTSGTTPWMAPELFNDALLSHACDIYSYAGVLLEISCPGKYPYHYMAQEIRIIIAKSQGELLDRIHYPELDGLDTLWDLIIACMAIRPQERYDISSVIRILRSEYSLSERVDQTVVRRPKLNVDLESLESLPKARPVSEPQEIVIDPGYPTPEYSTGAMSPPSSHVEDAPTFSQSYWKAHESQNEGSIYWPLALDDVGDGEAQQAIERAIVEQERERERLRDRISRTKEIQDQDRTRKDPLSRNNQPLVLASLMDWDDCRPYISETDQSVLFSLVGLTDNAGVRSTGTEDDRPPLPIQTASDRFLVLPASTHSAGSRPPILSEYTMAQLMDMEPTIIPSKHKKVGGDWYAIFNPQVMRALDINLVLTLNHNSIVCCVRFSNDGRYLATGCNRTAQVYDTRTGAKVCVLADENASQKGDMYIRSICFSPNGKLLATGAEDKRVRLWDIAKRKLRRTFNGHTQEITSLDFSRDGRVIVSGSGDRTARIWDVENDEHSLLAIVEPSTVNAGITSVAISPDGRHVAAGSLDTVVRIWDVATGHLIERLRGHQDSVYSVAFTPDGRGLVSGSLDKSLKYWNLEPLIRNPSRLQLLSQGGLVPSGRQPVAGDMGEKGSNCIGRFSGHKDYVLAVAVPPDGTYVVSGSKDRCVQFWDPRSCQTELMLQGHENSVLSIDLCPATGPGGRLLATGSGDRHARVWRYGTFQQ